MALEVLIGATAYRAVNDYQLRQQAGAISSTQITVQIGANPRPRVLQSIQILIDSVPVFAGIINSVKTPEFNTGFEDRTVTVQAQSLEAVLAFRRVSSNFYNKYIHEIVSTIFTSYIEPEGISLGSISTTTVQLDKYKKKDEKVSSILDDLAKRIDGATYYISADKKFYFLIRSDFSETTAPEHITDLSREDATGEIRSRQTVKGSSATIEGTADNLTLQADIASRAGTTGLIEAVDSDQDLHSDASAAAKAEELLSEYGEEEVTLRCLCHDLSKSELYTAWVFGAGLYPSPETFPSPELFPSGYVFPDGISGTFVVVERTISHFDGTDYIVKVTLRNRNYFARYGYSLKEVSERAAITRSIVSDIASDGKFTPVEKIAARARWLIIDGEKAGYDGQADDHGITTEKTVYDGAFQALADYLNGGTSWTTGLPLWISDAEMTVTEDIVASEFEGVWTDYEVGRRDLEIAITAATETYTDTEIARSQQGYLGPYLYPDVPEGVPEGYSILHYSETSGDEYRGVKRYAAGSWGRTTDPVYVAPAIRDIADICVITNDDGSPKYGTEADYGVTSSQIEHIRLALVDILDAGTVKVRGTIYGNDGVFEGQIDADPIKTEEAQTPGVITPPATRWLGQQFIDHIASLSDGDLSASGSFAGSTVSGVKKGTSAIYQSSDSETSGTSADWVTKKTLTCLVDGYVTISFGIKAGFASASGALARILKNGAQIYSTESNDTSYTEAWIRIDVAYGDEIVLQGKSEYALWTPNPYYFKEFRLKVATGTAGVGFSTGAFRVIRGTVYYDLDGNILVSGLADFVTDDENAYYTGTELAALLQSAGGSVWQKNDLEPSGWSETYSASIVNAFAGKACNAYRIEPTLVRIYNDDASETEILLSSCYAYSAANLLYPMSRSARFYKCGYRSELAADDIVVHEMNTNEAADDSHCSVKSLDAPRVDNDEAAKFESTRAKLINYYDGIYHEHLADDSFHNLVEEASLTITIDASAKTIARSSGSWSNSLIGVGEMLHLRGFSGAYAGNNGYFEIVEFGVSVLTYNNVAIAVPVSCSGVSSITAKFPIRQIYAFLDNGNAADVHKPRLQWGRQKGAGSFIYSMELSTATGRLKTGGGRKVTAAYTGSHTQNSVFAMLDGYLLYVNETMLMHGGIGDLRVSYCSKISSTVIRIYGMNASNASTYKDITDGSSTVETMSLAW